MSPYLYRLGHWAVRRRRLVLAFWVSLFVGIGAISQAVKKDTSDAFNVPGTESQRALDLLDERFPGSGAFLVRMTLVPAVLALLDRRAWWLPPRLDRRLPNLDIEGEKLMHDLETSTADAALADREPVPD
ncbi:MAG TPA: hypothetical protein VF066_01855 [Thermoleophilaceae bacterium]